MSFIYPGLYYFVLFFLLSITFGCSDTAKSPTDPDTSSYISIFGENVFVFDDSMDQERIQKTLDALHEKQKYNEFGSDRYALLFKPGTYDLDVTVDYYIQALGLGRHPDDVIINGTVQSITTKSSNGVANKVTTMFWRGAENFKVVQPDGEMMYWAVSQAAPYRRMHVIGDINFDRGSWASGGLLANSVAEGRAGLTSGQQWFTRNSTIETWEGGNWNRVFVGVEGAPKDTWPDQPTTDIDKTPVIREKPYLTHTASGSYAVFIPGLEREISGPSWTNAEEKGELIPLNSFHVADPEKDNAASLRSPGRYRFVPNRRQVEFDRGSGTIYVDGSCHCHDGGK